MSEPNATNVVAGPGLIYIAPLGTAQPVFDQHGENPVVWLAPWVAVGYTDSGIDLTYTPTIKEITVDEEAAPVLDILEKEKFVVSAHLAEATLANLNAAISASSLFNDLIANEYEAVTVGSLPLQYTMVGVQGPAPGTNLVRVVIMQKAIAMAAVTLKMTRKDKVIIPVTFDARKISGTVLFKIYDVFQSGS
jgi:hypothetical protein